MKRASDHSKMQPDISSYKKLMRDSNITTDTDSNWLITLSDLMSLLLVFFIMFHFMSRNFAGEKSRPKDNSVVAALDTPLHSNTADTVEKIKSEMDSAIKDLDLEEGVVVQTDRREVVVSIKDNITFRSADAEILKSSEPILDKIAGVIKNHPSLVVEIDGHTDNVPINTRRYPSNWELSVARSSSVLKYFINRHGIGPSRFSIKGDADQRPLVLNGTAAQRAQNRRVEIRLKETEP